MFYGPEQSAIHDERFGDLARGAAQLVLTGLAARGLTRGTVVDLGSGSGIYAARMEDAGYDVIGVDLSPAMVDLARRQAPRSRFTVGSLHDADLPSGVVAVTALGEALNYATDARAGLDALERVAGRAYAALAPDGLFVFDGATPGRSGTGHRRERFVEADGWAIGVRFDEHAAPPTLERHITIFVRDDGGYRRVEEHHVLHLYEPDAVLHVVRAAGFTAEVLDGYAGPVDFPGWKVFVATKPGP